MEDGHEDGRRGSPRLGKQTLCQLSYSRSEQLEL